MHAETRLKLASLAFAVMWTAMMWWWNAPLDAAAIVMLAIAGGIAGLLWYWLYGKWFRWFFERR